MTIHRYVSFPSLRLWPPRMRYVSDLYMHWNSNQVHIEANSWMWWVCDCYGTGFLWAQLLDVMSLWLLWYRVPVNPTWDSHVGSNELGSWTPMVGRSRCSIGFLDSLRWEGTVTLPGSCGGKELLLYQVLVVGRNCYFLLMNTFQMVLGCRLSFSCHFQYGNNFPGKYVRYLANSHYY